MAQRPCFMQPGVNQFHCDQTMDDLSDRILFLSLLHRAQQERIGQEWTKNMCTRIQNRALNGYVLAPQPGPVQHINAGIGLYQYPVWPCMPERKGTGAYIPNYNRGSYKYNGNAKQKKQTKPTKANGEKEEKHMVPCHTSPEVGEKEGKRTWPEVVLPNEWIY